MRFLFVEGRLPKTKNPQRFCRGFLNYMQVLRGLLAVGVKISDDHHDAGDWNAHEDN